MKTVLKAITPPILWRCARAVSNVWPERNETSPSPEKDSRHYDEVYASTPNYTKHYSESLYYFIWSVLVDRLRPGPPCRILDIGCGPGQLAALLYDKGVRDYVGIDFSGRTIEMARSACPQLQFVQADASRTDLLQTLDYNTVITTEFLEHIEKDLEVLSQIKPGTKVYGTVPNFPYPGHVRFFQSSSEVARRYCSLFVGFKVDAFVLKPQPANAILFLFEGVRGTGGSGSAQ